MAKQKPGKAGTRAEFRQAHQVARKARRNQSTWRQVLAAFVRHNRGGKR